MAKDKSLNTSNKHLMMLPDPSATSVHLICSVSLTVFRRKGLPPGSPLFLLSNMGLFCTKVLLSVCIMVGCLPARLPRHLTVFTVVIFQLFMHSAALMEPFLPSDTITYVTLLHHFCLKYVMMLRLNTISSHLLGKL